MTKTSKMNLIDLAGSERASKVLSEDVIDSAETAALRLKVKCSGLLGHYKKNGAKNNQFIIIMIMITIIIRRMTIDGKAF